MSKKIVIFGTGKIADVIQYYMREESKLPVVAFTADEKYIEKESFNDLPVIPFENIEEEYPPGEFDMFIALGYQELNELRANKVKEAREKGYELISYLHPDSSAPKDLEYGDNCFIMNNVCIHPRVKLGDNVFVWSGAMIGHHSEVGDNCWLTSCANVSGDVKVGKNCFFAVNATTGNSIEIGDDCFLGANALITKSLENNKVMIEESSKPFRLDAKQFIKIIKTGL